MLCHCGHSLSGFQAEGFGIASVFCASGHRFYIFKDFASGKWETAKQRQDRMKYHFTCAGCGKEKTIAALVSDNRNKVRFCDDCADKKEEERLSKRVYKTSSHKNNVKSPWRLNFQRAPENYHKTEWDNPR